MLVLHALNHYNNIYLQWTKRVDWGFLIDSTELRSCSIPYPSIGTPNQNYALLLVKYEYSLLCFPYLLILVFPIIIIIHKLIYRIENSDCASNKAYFKSQWNYSNGPMIVIITKLIKMKQLLLTIDCIIIDWNTWANEDLQRITPI